MGCILERKAQIIFITACSVNENGKKRKVVIQSEPTYALLKLNGSKEGFPMAWELIYEIAKRGYAERLRREARAEESRKRSKGKPGR